MSLEPLCQASRPVVLLSILAGLLTACGADKSEPAAAESLPGQSEFEKAKLERQRLLDEARARQAAEKDKRRAEVEAVGSVKLVKMRVKKGAASKGFDMAVEFKNNSDKELVHAEGRLEFYDAAGKLLKMAKMPLKQSIPAGESVTKKGKFPFSADSEGDATLAGLQPSKVDLRWIPLRYRFADGSTLEGVQ